MRALAGFGIGIAILATIFYKIGLSNILATLSSVNPVYLIIALAATPLTILVQSFRLKKIIESQKYPLKLGETAKIHAASMTVNMVTPVVKLGGVPLKLYLLTQKNIPTSKALAVQVSEAVFEATAFYTMFMAMILVLVHIGILPGPYAYMSLALFIAGAFLVLILPKVFSQKNVERLVRRLVLKYTKIDPRLFSKSFRESLKAIIKDRKVIFIAVLGSLLVYLVEFARIYLVFLALGMEGNLLFIISVWAIGGVLGFLPGLPSGLGVVEGGTISALALLGVPVALATSFIMLDRIVALWIPLVFGVAITANLRINDKTQA